MKRKFEVLNIEVINNKFEVEFEGDYTLNELKYLNSQINTKLIKDIMEKVTNSIEMLSRSEDIKDYLLEQLFESELFKEDEYMEDDWEAMDKDKFYNTYLEDMLENFVFSLNIKDLEFKKRD